MEFTCLGLGYDARMYKGIPQLAAYEPAWTDDHPVLTLIVLLALFLLE